MFNEYISAPARAAASVVGESVLTIEQLPRSSVSRQKRSGTCLELQPGASRREEFPVR